MQTRGSGDRIVAAVVDAYIRAHRRREEEELSFYAKCPSVDEAVRFAASARGEGGKKHPHQWRIPNSVLALAARQLDDATFGKCRNFDEVHELVQSLTASVRGFGELATYDTAHRIGVRLGLSPTSVYLHRGTREGALALGVGRGRRTIDLAELPAHFARLKPYEVEDCLCIYKASLRTVRP